MKSLRVLAFPLLLAVAVASTGGSVPHDGAEQGDCKPSGQDHDLAATVRRMVQSYATDNTKAQREELIRDIKLLWENQLEPSVFQDILKEALELLDNKKNYVDRFVQGYLDVQSDPDCTTRQFNVQAKDFDVEEASRVFRKCRVLVLKNALDLDFLTKYRDRFTNFVHSVNEGKTSPHGTSTWGEGSWVRDIDVDRWEMLLPKDFAHEQIVANDAVLDVLTKDEILGPEMVLHNFGAVLAEPGARPQDWHFDAGYLFSDSSLETSGVAGHDLPSYVVTMFAPLLNVTHDHGPTEFCLGSSYLQGFNPETASVQNKTLRKALDKYNIHVERYSRPPDCWHSVALDFGDLMLFDYQVEHRGGHNASPDLRSLLYLSYSRYWYRDVNFVGDFQEGHGSREVMLEHLLDTTRFAIPSKRDTTSSTKPGAATKQRLQDIKHILPDSRINEFTGSSEGEQFLVSNKDIVDPEQLFVMVGGRNFGRLRPGGSVVVVARPGDVVHVRSTDGQVILFRSVEEQQGQMVLSKKALTN